MPDEQDDKNQDQDAPQDQGGESQQPAAPAAPSPSPYEKELAEVKARQARIEELAVQAANAAAVTARNIYQTPQPSPYHEPEPEEDFDPMDKAQVRQQIRKEAEKIARGLVAEAKREVESTYAHNDTRFALMQRDRTYEELRKLGMEDLAPEVDQYIREANVTAQYLSDPRSWETLAATVLGRRKLREARENVSRAPLLGSAGGRSPSSVAASSTYQSTIIDDSDIQRAKAFGVSDDPEELEMFLRGPVSVVDLDKFEAKRAARRGRR